MKAVDDVSFSVYPGETIWIVGESGCEKTTLGKTILHLFPATEGEVIFQGKDILKLKGREGNSESLENTPRLHIRIRTPP